MASDEIKDETTLASIAENPTASESALLFAVIIDIAEPRKNEQCGGYSTHVKIIDPSFNYKSRVNSAKLKFHKFVHLSIFSETPDAAPRIKYVGDIIRLRRFRFKYTDRCELKGFEQNYSNWLVYPGGKNDPLTARCHKPYPKNADRPLNIYEKGRIADLRCWADHFFFVYSLRYITWWMDLPKPSDRPGAQRQQTFPNVDLLLRLKGTDASKTRLCFTDALDRIFELELPNSSLAPNDVIQLKCVTVTYEERPGGTRHLIALSHNSSCLHIPKFFLDNRVFTRNQPAEKPCAAPQAGPAFLADFAVERGGGGPGRVVSAVRLAARGMEVTPVAEVLRVFAEEPQSFLNKKFLIEGVVAGFLSLEPNQIIKRFYPQSKEVERLDQPVQEKKHQALYHLTPLIRDESLAADQHLQAHVLTNDLEPFMFDAWGILPAYDDAEGWAAVKENKVQEFVQKLNALKKPEFRVRLIVQLLTTLTGKFFFKVSDSVFVAF